MIVLAIVSGCGGWFSSKPGKHDSRRFGLVRNVLGIQRNFMPLFSPIQYRATCDSQGLSLGTYKRSISVTRNVPHTDGEKELRFIFEGVAGILRTPGMNIE